MTAWILIYKAPCSTLEYSVFNLQGVFRVFLTILKINSDCLSELHQRLLIGIRVDMCFFLWGRKLIVKYYLLTSWSRVLLEKLTGSAASQEIPHIFGTRRFLTELTSARHLSLSWVNSIQSPQPPPTSWRFILILSSHLRLGLPSGLFPSGFPTRTLCTPLPSPIRVTCPAHLILLDFTTRTILGKAYRKLKIIKTNYAL